MTPGLALDSVQLRHGRTTILHDLTLTVSPGEFLVLLGPSGSGKSTLLNAIAGLHPLTAGRILLAGRDLAPLEPGARDIAMVFQSFALYPTMNVGKNITFGLRMRGVPRAERQARLAEVARQLGLDPLLARRPHHLSGGQQQRVALARAMIRRPALFLFDEPLSSLDAPLRSELRAEIRRLHARTGTTALYVTHDQVEAMALATRIAVLHEGRIVQLGTPEALYDRPQSLFVARFIGAPGMNLLPGRIAPSGAVEVAGTSLPLPAYDWANPPEPGRPVLLGIRPEDIAPGTGPHPLGELLVTQVEPTGPDTLLRLAIADAELIARVPRGIPHAPGAPAPFFVNTQRIAIFCPATGNRL